MGAQVSIYLMVELTVEEREKCLTVISSMRESEPILVKLPFGFGLTKVGVFTILGVGHLLSWNILLMLFDFIGDVFNCKDYYASYATAIYSIALNIGGFLCLYLQQREQQQHNIRSKSKCSNVELKTFNTSSEKDYDINYSNNSCFDFLGGTMKSRWNIGALGIPLSLMPIFLCSLWFKLEWLSYISIFILALTSAFFCNVIFGLAGASNNHKVMNAVSTGNGLAGLCVPLLSII